MFFKLWFKLFFNLRFGNNWISSKVKRGYVYRLGIAQFKQTKKPSVYYFINLINFYGFYFLSSLNLQQSLISFHRNYENFLWNVLTEIVIRHYVDLICCESWFLYSSWWCELFHEICPINLQVLSDF